MAPLTVSTKHRDLAARTQAGAILGLNRWKCTSRATNYMDSRSPRGYDPVHTKPWELIPNGIVATVQAPADARVEVKTASGRVRNHRP